MTQPARTLITDIHTLLPMTGTREGPRVSIQNAAVLVGGGVILWVGHADVLPPEADGAEVIWLPGHLVLPGLVNTHHHLYQTLTRCLATDSGLFDWLKTLYPIWMRLTPEGAYLSAAVGLAELALSGCTTSSDHLYLYSNGVDLGDTVRAASDVGLRFHATRGSMSLGESQGGLPPDAAVEGEAHILRESERLVRAYHDPARHAMTRVALAPCSPFSVTAGLMRDSALLARDLGVMLHTHLAETEDEDAFCLSRVGMRPLDYVESLGWVGEDVWFAHGVHFSPTDAARLGACGCGVAHCPSSNMRLASGIAPVRELLSAGVKVGLGVDGSASNDGSHLLAEARQSLLISRLRRPQNQLKAWEALWLATRGGAEVLNRDDIGQLAPGMSADLIALDLNRLEYAGATHDPAAAAVLCAPRGIDFSMVNGRVVVQEGRLTTLELPPLLGRHRAESLRMIRGE
ncbi:8-oxoguanine deaminase [Deinococcus radiomollis]|uniref:8-oxoguanine deaminase n=1 Tax=Deinococcus radiomollis TaxID=468916 RepID=UPI0038921762